MKKKLSNQKGFTLIEIIAVLVILGILAAVAIPKYQDLQHDAQQNATIGMAGHAASAAALNYSASLLNTSKAVPVETCAQIEDTMDGGLPTGYSLDGTINTADGCTMSGPDSTSATFFGKSASW